MRVDPLPSRPMKSETNNGGGSTLKFPQCRAESCSGNHIELPVSDVFFFLLGGLVRNRDEGEPSRMSSRQNYCVDAAVLPWWPAVVSEVAFVCRIHCSCVLLCSQIRIFEIAGVGKFVFNHFSCGITFLTFSHFYILMF